jgi:hypothetical protein
MPRIAPRLPCCGHQDIRTDIEQFFHALTLHEIVYLGTSIGSAGLPLAALFRLARFNPRFDPAE